MEIPQVDRIDIASVTGNAIVTLARGYPGAKLRSALF
jgi:hypothetical protein